MPRHIRLMNGRNVYIWGTGRNAVRFVTKFRRYFESELFGFKDEWIDTFKGFIDSNPGKSGSYFYGKQVVTPEKAYESDMDFCVITPTMHAAIDEKLINWGFSKTQYVYWEEFLDGQREYVLQNRGSIPMTSGDILYECQQFANKFEEFLYLNDENSGWEMFKALLGEYPLAKFIDMLEWYFGDRIDDLEKILKEISAEQFYYNGKKNIKTVGLYTDRYYGGGIEKVVSLLIPKLLKAGLKVVLITEEIRTGKEYPLPEGVIRCNLTNNHDAELKDRLEEFGDCVIDNKIDAICCHSGYARVGTFYELLYFRMMGIPVTIEIHSAFLALISDQKEISYKFKSIYHMADRVITLSDVDRFFWESQGCRCTCIPNPIESFGIKARPRRGGSGKTKTILWVGRLVSRPKQVFDIVPIMLKVVMDIPEAKLAVIGGKDNDADYKSLMDAIEKNGLKDSIEICEYSPDISDMYKEADIVLMTSASECSPNVIYESKIFARPLVMYNIPWLPAVQDGRGITVVDQNDIEAAANAIVELLSDDLMWIRQSEAAWKSVQDMMSHDIDSDWVSLFNEIASEKVVDSNICMPIGASDTINLLLDQFYGRGYQYRIYDEIRIQG